MSLLADCQKTYPAEIFGGKNSVKGNRQGSLSRSITRRSDQNCKIILQILILQFYRQLVKKFQKDFFDKLNALLFQRRAGRRLFSRIQHGFHKIARTGFGLHIGFPHIFANHARGSKLQAADRPDRRRW